MANVLPEKYVILIKDLYMMKEMWGMEAYVDAVGVYDTKDAADAAAKTFEDDDRFKPVVVKVRHGETAETLKAYRRDTRKRE